MSRWSFEDLRNAMERFARSGEPDDSRSGKRQRILSAATDLFIRHGYRRVSVDEVAREAAVAKGTVYLYFETKADLLVQAILEEKKRYLDHFRPIFEPDITPRERLRLWLRSVLVLGSEMPLTSRLLSGEREVTLVMEELDADLQERALEIQLDFLAWLLGEAAPHRSWSREELRDRALVLISVFRSADFFVDERHRAGMPLDRFADLLSSVLVDGVVGPAAPPFSREAG